MDLGEGLRKAIARLSGATIIDSKTIREFNKELQKALLSSDVEVGLVLTLTRKIEDAALKSKLPTDVSPKDYITNLVYEELVKLMGKKFEPELRPKRILLLGLYGSGKTTTSAKLAKFYQDRRLSAGLVCCDVARPAAYEQLETLAKQAGVGFFGIKGEKSVRRIVKEGLLALKDKKVVIFDSSGRNALDRELIAELKEINDEVKPDERMLVISADIGQVAGKQAREFDSAVGLTGVIVTKLDGSGKGGGALSAVNAAKVNITFTGVGEKLGNIELYDSKKFVGRLLGIPDIESLITHVQEAVKEANLKPEEMEVTKLNFDAFYTQLKAMSKMGPIKNMLGMMGMADVPKEALEQSEGKLRKYKSIIGSMTREERLDDKLIHDQKRMRRVAAGSGTTEKDVRELLKDFANMKKMMGALQNDRDMKRKLSKFMPKM
ncbi:MAG: signal recognition particle receptor subunit alpha [Candidatus Micrarchaeota archaeon]|nr:signal recognition particle receptor subunit alpha [Candidatus Micrarchaeota archaeon]MDE1847965.1 signal recognition particle receptor subunit alpha [Candidatus Micrarchaeota archaeon]MDE1864317.1 signal recognition particle receptor subunit alpha [Candidatus Micrarchaeota archaeon]